MRRARSPERIPERRGEGRPRTEPRVLWVADVRKLYKIDLGRAHEAGNCATAVLGRATVDAEMGPSFLAWDGKRLWFGRHVRSGTARIFAVEPEPIVGSGREATVTPSSAAASFEIAPLSQGATFDRQGNLWLSQSNSKLGRLQKIDASTGKVLQEFDLMAGVEDLASSPTGSLWSVSEAVTTGRR